MIEINSKYTYSVGLPISYQEVYEKNHENLVAFNQDILCVIYGSQFVDEKGMVNTSQKASCLKTGNHMIVVTDVVMGPSLAGVSGEA